MIPRAAGQAPLFDDWFEKLERPRPIPWATTSSNAPLVIVFDSRTTLTSWADPADVPRMMTNRRERRAHASRDGRRR